MSTVFSNTKPLLLFHQVLKPYSKTGNIHSLPLFNLPIIGAFMWLMPPRPYRAMFCWERELTLDHIHTFWPHEDRQDLPGWGMSSMLGPPLRQHENERRYTPFTHSFILTRQLWKNDYDGQVMFGDHVGLKLPDVCLTSEGKPRKNLTQETCPVQGSNPGPLHDRRACYCLLHSGGQLVI